MAKGMQLVFPITSTLNAADLSNKLKTMRDIVKQKPLTIDIDIASETGKSLTEKLGGGEQFFNMVQQSVGNVGKLKTEYSLFADAAGKAIKIATSETKEYRDETGNVIREVISLKTEEQALAEAVKKGGSAKIGAATAESNWRKQAQLTEAEINKEMNAVTANTKAAEKYLEKSKNMRGPQVEAAKKAAQAVLDEGRALQKTSPLAKDFGDKVEAARKANENFKVSLEGVKTGANVFQNFSSRIANAIQQTIAYSFSIGLVYKAQQLLNDAVKYAIDLNAEMTKIQVLQAEGAKTPEEINSLAQSFNKLGQEMGASTLEIAKGSVEWFRQGRTVDETQKLMRASMMLSKLGAMESADATNYLTSITNAFKISVGDTTSVVDKLIAVDNIAATSAGELATALRYTSESAALAGVEMEQLISYIGTVSTVTRQNAEMIGQAFKTMFARMTLIQGGGTDEEGWTISKVEKSLTAVGIEMKKADGTFRNMGDVLEDTAAKWNTLGERERIEIAVAIGGVRQKEAFLVLMDNMDKALQYQAAQYDATGLAADRYGIYLESIQAKQGKLTASMQELYASLINSNTISVFYDIAIGIVQTITQGKLLIPILLIILGLMIEINRQKIGGALTSWMDIIRADLKSVTGLLTKFKIEMAVAKAVSIATGTSLTGVQGIWAGLAGTLGITVGALSTVAAVLLAVVAPLAIAGTAWYIHKKQVENATKTVEDFIALQAELPKTIGTIKELANEIRTLKDAQAAGYGGDTKKQEADAEALAQAYEKLYEINKNLDWSWKEGRPYLEQASDAKELIEKAKEATEATEDQTHALYIYAQENLRNYLIGKNRYDQEVQMRDVLEEVSNIYTKAGKGTAGADAVKAYMKELYKGYDNLPIAAQAGLDAANRVIKGSALEMPGTEDWEKRLGEAIVKANSAVSEDKTVIASFENMFKKLISLGIKSANGDMEKWLENILKIFPQLTGLKDEVVTDTKNLVRDAREARAHARFTSGGHGRGMTGQYPAEYEALKKLDEEFQTQIDLIGNLADVQNDWNSKMEDGKVSALEFQGTLEKVNEQAALLGPSFKIKTIDDFIDKVTKKLDLSGMQDYIDSIKETITDSVKLSNLTPEMQNVIIDMLNSISAASISTVSQSINGIILGEQELSRFAEVAAADIWSLSEQEKIALYDINGVILETSGNTDIAIRNGLLDYDRFLADLTKRGSKYLNDFNILLGQSLKYASGGLYKPAPAPWGGGGGGGGGGATPKDPRIAELEDLIEKEEDRKEVLEDQIEQLNRQKEAIDKLIEAENWRKELIDRQIAGYQDQIDDLSRQVDLYGRQKDAIDELINAQEELIKPLEKQLDDLDKQLDDFNKIIDAKKESLQNTKDEADYLEELTNKTKKLGKTQAELALASLDDSEEGQKRRLELEEQLGADTEDLTKYTEDRKFDLQMKGIDDAQKAFENNIEAQKLLIQSQIDDINLVIDGFNLQKEAIDDLIKPLEDQKLALEDLIYPLEQQKEKIDLVIQGYDDQKRAIDALIEPIQDVTRAIDDQIELWNEEKEAIQEIIDKIGGGGGGGGGRGGNLPDALNVLDLKVKEVMDKIKARFGDLMTDLGITETHMQQLVQKWIDAGDSADGAYLKAKRYIEFIQRNSGEGNYGPPTVISNPSPQHPNIPHPQEYHEGGIAVKHGDETIKGVLKDSEIFAKLLKGEYVATEDQMRNFLKKTLPNIASEINMMLSEEDKALKAKGEGGGRTNANNINESSRRPSSDIIEVEINGPPRRPSDELIKSVGYGTKPHENAYRDINIEIPITVQGSLDKTILPNLERVVIKAINKSLEKRGIKRTADNFAI